MTTHRISSSLCEMAIYSIALKCFLFGGGVSPLKGGDTFGFLSSNFLLWVRFFFVLFFHSEIISQSWITSTICQILFANYICIVDSRGELSWRVGVRWSLERRKVFMKRWTERGEYVYVYLKFESAVEWTRSLVQVGVSLGLDFFSSVGGSIRSTSIFIRELCLCEEIEQDKTAASFGREHIQVGRSDGANDISNTTKWQLE